MFPVKSKTNKLLISLINTETVKQNLFSGVYYGQLSNILSMFNNTRFFLCDYESYTPAAVQLVLLSNVVQDVFQTSDNHVIKRKVMIRLFTAYVHNTSSVIGAYEHFERGSVIGLLDYEGQQWFETRHVLLIIEFLRSSNFITLLRKKFNGETYL